MDDFADEDLIFPAMVLTFASKVELLKILSELQPQQLAQVGYLGKDGAVHSLEESDLVRP